MKFHTIGVLLILFCLLLPFAARGNENADLDLRSQRTGNYTEAIQFYSQALNSSELTDKDRAIVLFHRANVYNILEQYQKSISDYNEAIRLQPDNIKAIAGRGSAYEVEGKFQEAIDDFTQVIKLSPRYDPVYFARGTAYFATAQYVLAVKDFQESVKLNPTYLYGILWLHIARTKTGVADDEALRANSAKIDHTAWPAPIVFLYLGQISSQEVRVQAEQAKKSVLQNRLCEFLFFYGEYELINKQTDSAQKLLKDTTHECPVGFFEHTGAAAELSRISQSQ